MSQRMRIAVSTQMLVWAVCAAAAWADNQTVIYQDGTGGYAGQVDNQLGSEYPDVFRGKGGTDTIYGDTSPIGQALIRFDGIPMGASIVSATLTLQTASTGDGQGDGGTFYRMLQPWTGASTYNSLGSGVQANGIEAASTMSFQTTSYVYAGPISFDVTADVQAWAGGTINNYGWVIIGKGQDGWGVRSGEYADYTLRPKLTIVYSTSHSQDTWADLSSNHVWNTTSANWLSGGRHTGVPGGRPGDV